MIIPDIVTLRTLADIYTKKELAGMVSISKRQLYRYLNDEVKNPSKKVYSKARRIVRDITPEGGFYGWVCFKFVGHPEYTRRTVICADYKAAWNELHILIDEIIIPMVDYYESVGLSLEYMYSGVNFVKAR